MQHQKVRSLTIGMVLDDSLDSNDGVQQYVRLVGGWMSSQGHSVHYVTSSTKRTDLDNVHSLGKVLRVGYNKNTVGTPLPVKKKRVKKLFSDVRFDVLHVQMPYSPFFAHRILRRAPAEVAKVGTFHILPFSFMEQMGVRALGITLRSSLAQFSGSCGVSEPAANLCKSAFGLSDTAVIPNAVNQKRFQQDYSAVKKLKGSKKIVFLGRLVKRKGCMELLQALAIIKTTLVEQDCQVYICSDGPERVRLEAFVSKNGLTDHVTFLGFISGDEKVAYLQQANIAVFPSLGGESFGIVLLEAMSAGAEVVLAGNNAGYTSVMKSLNEQIVDPLNAPEFARKIAQHLTDDAGRWRLKKLQLQYVQRFDINVVGPQIETMYQDAIALQQKNLHNRK